MDWVIFSLLSRALWAGSNITDKLLREKHIPDSFILTLVAGFAVLFLSLGIMVFNGLNWLSFTPVILVLFAGAVQIVAVFAFYQAISKDEISRVIPLFQLTPIFVLILSFLFLGEVLTFNHYLSFLLILLGGFLVSLKKVEGVFRLRGAFWWMILCGLIYAIQIVILKPLYVNYPFWDLTAYLGFGQFIPTIILVLIPRFGKRFIKSMRELKISSWTLLISSMFLALTASLSGFWALVTGPVSLISVFRGFQSVFVLAYAVFFSIWLPRFFKEELDKRVLGTKVLAILLMGIGLYLIYI